MKENSLIGAGSGFSVKRSTKLKDWGCTKFIVKQPITELERPCMRYT